MVTITCAGCGTDFTTKLSWALKGHKYCSKQCMSVGYRSAMKGANNPHWKGGVVEIACANCGKTFMVNPGRAGERKYCSRACMGAAKVGKPISMAARKPRTRKPQIVATPRPIRVVSCKQCGVAIDRHRTFCDVCTPHGKGRVAGVCEVCHMSFMYRRCESGRRYCSRACAQQRSSGAHNGNWKGGRLTLAQLLRACPKNRAIIAATLRRDKFTCQLCGQVGGDLEVDHVKPFSDILEEFLREHMALDLTIFAYELFSKALKYRPFWSRKNLRVLCRKCNWIRQLERLHG